MFDDEVLLNAVDLDKGEPAIVQYDAPGIDIYAAPGSIKSAKKAVSATWDSDDSVTYTRCRDQIMRLGELWKSYTIDASDPDLSFCIRTEKGQIAFVSLIEKIDDKYLVKIKLWRTSSSTQG
ncbi:hypothetical protein [Sphaerisporangium rubeum]|uniref:Uncharacterized protein n=1 Tax=Sphaerisporangium rubeum TaxID=321317 RepID=A0A7X0IA96_9ACTN|nr:hypothetical protein [Sphaerisporangium rubeum]MBB6471524.1 hypothetical protein [Sphaerisporangium rubeum]